MPCRSIGGDFYDYVDLPTGAFGFALGDVAGKGPPAALLSAMMQGIFAAQAAASDTPCQTIARVNLALYKRGIESRFVTLMYGSLEPDGRLTYCNAGHNPPLVVGQGRRAPARSRRPDRRALRAARSSRKRPSSLDARRLADRLQRRRVGGDVGRRRGVRRGAHPGRASTSRPSLAPQRSARGDLRRRARVHQGRARRATTSRRWCLADAMPPRVRVIRRHCGSCCRLQAESAASPCGIHDAHRKRLLILWFALAFVVWNGIYDMRLHDTMRGYLLQTALAQAGLGRGVEMRAVPAPRPGRRDRLRDRLVARRVPRGHRHHAHVSRPHSGLSTRPLSTACTDAPADSRLEPHRRAEAARRCCWTTRRCATGCSRRRCAARPSTRSCSILHLIDRLGIDTADIGLPGAGPHVVRDVERLAQEIVDQRLKVARQLRGADAGRRHQADRRDLAARRHADRVLRVHRVEPAAAVRRRLDARPAAAADRGSDHASRSAKGCR